MNSQPFENPCPEEQKKSREAPKVQRIPAVFKEPDLTVYRLSVSVYYINKGVDHQYLLYRLVSERRKVPHDRCSPHQYLQDDRDQLSKVSEKYADSACRIADPQYQYKNAKAVVKDLQAVKAWIISVD